MAECVAPSQGFAAAAKTLLNILGYDSDRKDDLSGDVAEFMREYPAADTESARQFREAADSVNIVFQFAESEISQGELGERIEFDKGIAKSFLFVAADLKKGRYSRSDYARFVREINKRFSAPTVALFRRPESKNKAVLTLAFVGRRQSQTQHGRDVLEKVSLLREIQCDDPHRGHLDILAQLSLAERFNWIKGENKSRNFDGLLAAWLDELDAEALNRRFYGDLREWFKMARDNAVFPRPSDAANNRAAADSVIRLITRMMFIWFIKEKKLVADQLFSESQISPLLANYNADKGDTYYRAILQNLFFATLNTEIKDRRFSNRNNDDHRNPNLFRYKDLMSDSDTILELMNQTPFINGGLFDCLDDFEGVLAGGRRVDCFTDNPSQRKELRVPNTLFFSKEKKKFGLLTIFKRYKFTVEENTPVEQEVALDPELLGKVFENLLAEEINPETRNTVRRQTGSFYTPRVVVDYMADESLSAYLAAKVSGNGDRQWRQKLRDLFDYAKTGCENIAKDKIARLVGAVADIKVLDPACGSGAFPMGVLNKLALALSKLDPENREWKKLQQKRSAGAASEAFYGDYEDNDDARAVRLDEINKTFADYSKPFGRKLFLIQNSIFGVDIQPIACQIAKLRFFISLAIEQEKKGDKKNYGIRPLPNLETRFVAADTLIGIGGEARQGELGGDEIAKLQKQLAENRERHFNASVRSAKMQCRKEDKRLRGLLAEELKKIPGFAPAAKGIAAWNPYDQNAVAGWFDSKWMFGVDSGFDVVIGNPPYVQLQRNRGEFGRKYQGENFASFAAAGDIYMLFCDRGLSLLSDGGLLTFITSNSWMQVASGAKLRRHFLRHNPRMLVNMGVDVFDHASVDTCILMVENAENRGELLAADAFRRNEFPPSEWVPISPQNDDAWVIFSLTEQGILSKIKKMGTPIKDWNVHFNFGVKTGYSDAFVIDEHTKRQLCKQDPKSADFLKPVVRGRDIERYTVNSVSHLIKIEQGWTNANRGKMSAEDFMRDACPAIYAHLLPFVDQGNRGAGLRNRMDMGDYWWELRPCTYYAHFEKEKLVWRRITSRGRFAFDAKKLYSLNTTIIMTGADIKYLLAVLNSRLVSWQMRSISPTLAMDVLEWGKVFVGKLPIRHISKAEQRPFAALAEKITAAKAANPAADTSKMEAEIDKMVYGLYRLNKDEIKIIESSVP